MAPQPKSTEYQAIHMRMRRLKGRAAEQSCVDCAGPAMDWSYDGEDPDEVTVLHSSGRTICAISTKPEHYVARCRSCHCKHDKARKMANPTPQETAA